MTTKIDSIIGCPFGGDFFGRTTEFVQLVGLMHVPLLWAVMVCKPRQVPPRAGSLWARLVHNHHHASEKKKALRVISG